MILTLSALKLRREKLALTYGLSAVENGFELMYPFAIGVAINGLLMDNLWSLLPLALIWLAHTTSGYLRQRFDTRLFMDLFASLAAQMAVSQREEGESTSDIAARTDMVEELVEFLETDVPEAMTAVFGLVGGAVMLLFYDWLTALGMAALLLPAALIYLRFGRNVKRMEQGFNNRSEREVAVIHRGSAAGVRRHFRHLARWRIRVSDAEARTWSVLELMSLVVFAAILIRLTSIDDMMAGDIFAAVAYAVSMLVALDRLPGIVGSVARMADNVRRFDLA